jgi:hypothetical protein
MVVYAALLIALMLLRPQGIFGTHELWDLPFFKRRARRAEEARLAALRAGGTGEGAP